MAIDGVALGTVAAGSLLIFAGLKGYSIPQTIQDVIQGKSPINQNVAHPIGDTSGVAQSGIVASGPSSATGAAIAQDALQYKQHIYGFGGAPGTSGQNPWDCSSFVNYVIGHDMHMSIPDFPNGSYTGAVHGPTSFSYAAWTGATTIGHDASVAQAGDLCIWMNAIGHIGIAIGNGQMISALGPDGTPSTIVTGITGTASGIFMVRRINQTIQVSTGGGNKR